MACRPIEPDAGARSADQPDPPRPDGGPERTCVGCRRRWGVAELVRISLTAGGVLVAGTGSGRGAWLCRRSQPCFERAAARGTFSRALRAEVGGEAVAELRTSLWSTADAGPSR